MRKVLIIAEFSHASPRIPGLAKYLPEFDWQATLITGSSLPEEGCGLEIMPTPYPNVLALWKAKLRLDASKGFQEQIGIPRKVRDRKSLSNYLIRLMKGILAYPDEEKHWKPVALKACEQLLNRERMDLIMSSSSPVTSHLVAREVKRRYGIGWLADLRDLWTQNHNYRYGAIRKMIERRLEVKTLRTADALLTVSSHLAEKLKTLHQRNEIYTITNGFHPEKVNLPPDPLTSGFTISYTGQIYRGKQDPTRLFAALRDLISGGKIDPRDIEVRFYGPENESLRSEINRYGLSEIVRQQGMVSIEVALQKQRESQLLLLLNWEDERERGVYTGKVFEYLAAQRPIIVIGGSGDDVVTKLIAKTKAGFCCTNIEEVKTRLNRSYLEFKEKKKVSYRGEIEEINKYSYRALAKQLASLFDSIA